MQYHELAIVGRILMVFILPTKPYHQEQCQVASFQPKDFWDCLSGQVLSPYDWLMVALNTMDQS